MPKKKSKLSFIEDFGLSGTAAVMSKTCVAPLERIKLVVQTQDELVKKGVIEKPFKGIAEVTNYILKNEGAAAFWKGNFPNCVRYFPTQALNFAFKEKIKNYFNPVKSDPFMTKMCKNVGAGSIAAAISMTAVYSLDYARTRLSTDMKSGSSGKRQYSGLVDVYKQTIASDGVMGLYKGYPISLIGIILYRGPYFGFYDTAKGMDMFKAPMEYFVGKFAVGYACTLIANVFCYPIDTIRRRMMLTVGGAVQYSSSMECAGAIMREGGIGRFYKGYVANALRSIGAPMVLAGFDTLKTNYEAWKYPDEA